MYPELFLSYKRIVPRIFEEYILENAPGSINSISSRSKIWGGKPIESLDILAWFVTDIVTFFFFILYKKTDPHIITAEIEIKIINKQIPAIHFAALQSDSSVAWEWKLFWKIKKKTKWQFQKLDSMTLNLFWAKMNFFQVTRCKQL